MDTQVYCSLPYMMEWSLSLEYCIFAFSDFYLYVNIAHLVYLNIKNPGFSGCWSSWGHSLGRSISILPSLLTSSTQPLLSPLRWIFPGQQAKIFIERSRNWIFQDCGSKLVPCHLSCGGLVQSEPGRNWYSVTVDDNDGLVQPKGCQNSKADQMKDKNCRLGDLLLKNLT